MTRDLSASEALAALTAEREQPRARMDEVEHQQRAAGEAREAFEPR